MSFHFFLSATNSLHLLTHSTWRSLSTSSFHTFLGLPLLLVPSSSWVKIFLGILSSSILSRWPNQLILCPFIHFTIFSPFLISSSSRFVLLFHSPFSYLGPYSSKYFPFKNYQSLFFFDRRLYVSDKFYGSVSSVSLLWRTRISEIAGKNSDREKYSSLFTLYACYRLAWCCFLNLYISVHM